MALSEKQQLLKERLKLIGPGAVDFFEDACRTMSDPTLKSSSHLIGHLVREIESMTREVLMTFSGEDAIKDSSGRHKAEVLIILKALNYDQSDDVAVAWLGMTGKDNSWATPAHREHLNAPRKIDHGFRSRWDTIQMILGDVLGRFEKKYLKVFQIIDSLAQKEMPTRSDVRLLYKIPNNIVAHKRFFDQIASPEWLTLLRNESFLKSPSSTEYGQVWPVTVYFKKMASVEPDTISQIIDEIDKPASSRIVGDLVDVFNELPGSHLPQVLPKVVSWIEDGTEDDLLFLERPIKNLLVKCIEEDYADAAYMIVKAFLKPGHDVARSTDREFVFAPGLPKAKTETWQYREFLDKNLDILIRHDPGRTFKLICDLIETYLPPELSQAPLVKEFISRIAISEDDHYPDQTSTLNALIGTAVKTALELIEVNTEELALMVEYLQTRKSTVFDRIGLYLLSKAPQHAIKLVTNYLTDTNTLNRNDIAEERGLLLQTGLGLLETSERDVFFNWVQSAEGLNYILEGQAALDEDQAKYEILYTEIWQRDQLSLVEDHLSPNWKVIYQDLLDRHGDPELSEIRIHSAEWLDPVGEYTAEQLSELDHSALVNVLTDWQPKLLESGIIATKKGLSRALIDAVTSEADRFSNASDFRGIDPEFIQAYFEAQGILVRQKYEANWSELLSLCEWVVQRDVAENSAWTWTRIEILRVLIIALKWDLVDIELRYRLWPIVQEITNDRHPSKEEEEGWLQNNMTPYGQAINGARSLGLIASILYALWLYRRAKPEQEKVVDDKPVFKLPPEVAQVLNRHLDPKNDSSIAVRAVYGMYFPLLLQIDRTWTKENIANIFSDEQEATPLSRSAWDTLVLDVKPYNESFSTLKEYYYSEIRAFSHTENITRLEKNITQHLIIQYLRGNLKLSEEIMGLFWDVAPVELRYHALSFIGMDLVKLSEKMSNEMLERCKKLWEFRVDQITTADVGVIEEMSAFELWFASGCFDPHWCCEQFLIALDYGYSFRNNYLVLKKLIELADCLPLESVQILEKITLAAKEKWMVMGRDREIREVLLKSLKSTDNYCQVRSTELINLLTARGYGDFSDLLD